MSTSAALAGLELVGEFIDSLDDADRELSEGERAYLRLIVEATKEEGDADIDIMDREGDKSMSAMNNTSGGALVPPARQVRRKVIAPRLSKSFGVKAHIPAHNPGDIWRSNSGRWYTMNQDHRVVPAKDPNQQDENKPDKQETEEPTQLGEQGQPPAEEIKKGIMKQVTDFASKNGEAVKRMLRKVKVATMKKLAPKNRVRLKKMAAAAAWVEHKMQTVTHTTQGLMDEFLKEKGVDPTKAKKISNAVKFADAAFQWTVNIPIAHHVLEATGIATGAPGIIASKVGGFMPVASLAFVAIAPFADPFAFALAADKIIRHGIPKHEEEHGQKPKPKQSQPQQKALPDEPNQFTQTEDAMGGNQDPEGMGGETQGNFDESTLSELIDVLNEAEDTDWATAVFCAAVDHLHDAKQAVDATRAALEVYPSGPKVSEEDEIIEEEAPKSPMTKVGPSPFASRVKSMYGRKSSGGTCKQGERSDLTGCTPATKEPSAKKPSKKPNQQQQQVEPQSEPEKRTGPSKPEDRNPDAKPPSLEVKVKPPPPMAQSKAPKNAEGKPTTGYTASGMTNTSFGDMVETISSQLGMRSILPEGRRSNKNVKKEGSSIDVEYDHSGYAFEVKAVCVEATEYKAKPKKDEVEGKRKFAEMHNLKPAMMIVVTDVSKGKAWAYWREGIGAYALNPNNLTDWNYAGELEFTPPQTTKE